MQATPLIGLFCSIYENQSVVSVFPFMKGQFCVAIEDHSGASLVSIKGGFTVLANRSACR